jgi:hypothetical protein
MGNCLETLIARFLIVILIQCILEYIAIIRAYYLSCNSSSFCTVPSRRILFTNFLKIQRVGVLQNLVFVDWMLAW